MRNSRYFRYAAMVAFTSSTLTTGTVLASDDGCQVSLVHALVDATKTVNGHTAAKHKHTKETLAAWEKWGEDYLAKHGHPYVPPKPLLSKRPPMTPEERQAFLKFECASQPVLTVEQPVSFELPEEDTAPSIFPVFPQEIATEVQPGLPGTTAPAPPEEGISTPVAPPIFLGGGGGSNGGGTTPPGGGGTTPPATTPEPSSLALLGTGICSAWLTVRRRGRQA